MVHKMKRRYGIFGESLVLTILILLLGFFLGMFFEVYRTQGVVDDYRSYELEALDLKLQNYYYQIMDRSACDAAVEQNFVFADNLYNDGLRIEEYEEANQLTDAIKMEKKRYVLLKTELWLNSVLLKEKCNKPFDTVVYFYSNEPKSTILENKQDIISNVLGSVKDKKGDEIILLPIAGDMGLGAVDLQIKTYDVETLPSILINENIVLEGFHTEEEILGYLD